MKRSIIYLLLILSVTASGQNYSGNSFTARGFFNSPVYKLNGVSLDSLPNASNRGFLTTWQYNKLMTGGSQWTASSSDIYYSKGRVGIGLNSPSYDLDVDGDINITTGHNFKLNGTNITVGASQWTTTGSNIYYNTGNVGIGNSSPESNLDIKTTGTLTKLSIRNSSSRFILGVDGASSYIASLDNGPDAVPLDFYMGTTFAARFNTLGYFGIGTTTPAYKLDVNGTIRTSSNIIVNGAINYGTDAEANDTYVCAIAGITSYTEGMIIYIKCNTANTGACSVNVNSLGVKSLKILHDQDPPDSYIEAGSIIHAIYDGTNFQVLTPDANP